jgi:Lon-like ATP-dependent protease
MVGEPGTGKSMLAAAMAEMMGAHDLEDVLVVPNPESRINPQLEVVAAGEGEQILREAKKRRSETETSISYLFGVALVAVSLIAAWYSFTTKSAIPGLIGAVIAIVLLGIRRFFRSPARLTIPKLLVNNARALEADRAPFVDATGFHAGALLGDVRHDPFQSGGYETPPHDLVEPGAIHLAHRGVLFIDEVSTLSIESQQSLLTAIQEKRFPISGRTLGSSGTMIRTNPAPCDFLLILAGNMQDVEKMHPALRSRVRGYGYELYMNEEMPDTPENREKLARFCAQEVTKDRKIPHLRRDAVEAVVDEARVRAGRPELLTTRLRELGGLIRAAGDLAAQEGAPLVEPRHVLAARENTRTLEEQIASRQAAR